MTEFCSSPSLMDEMEICPLLWRRFVDAIPDIADRANKHDGDLVKIHGVVHIWAGGQWVNIQNDRKASQ